MLREHSLLCNPRVPAHVLAGARSEALIELPGLGEGESTAQFAGRTLAERLLHVHADTTVLELSGPLPDYRSVLPVAEVGDFEHRLQSYASLWCCNHPPGGKGAGHIWYDFLWDILPHSDRHGREWKNGWTPIMGP